MIGELLKAWRQKHDVTVRDAATQIGISAATVSRIERGNPMDLPTWMTLQQWLLSAPGGTGDDAEPKDEK